MPVNHLLRAGYSTSQMSRDLARLRRNGLIQRQTHRITCILTSDGRRVAVFYYQGPQPAPAPAPGIRANLKQSVRFSPLPGYFPM